MLAVVGRVKINMLPFDGAPEALDEGVIGGAPPAVSSDTAAGGAQGLPVSAAGKLAALGDAGASLASELKMYGAGATRRASAKACRQKPTSSELESCQLST